VFIMEVVVTVILDTQLVTALGYHNTPPNKCAVTDLSSC